MKLFIKTLLLFTLFAVFFYCISLFAWGHLLPSYLTPNLKYKMGLSGYMYTRLKEVKKTKAIDVLFLGSSHTYRGFDPRIFAGYHLSSFNLGSSNQTPVQTEDLLTLFLDSLKPGFIIYEVYPDNFITDGVESSIDLISNNELGNLSFNQAFKVNHIIGYNTLLFAAVRKSIFNDDAFVEPGRNALMGDTYIEGGFVQKDLKYNTETKVYTPKKWVLNKKQVASFERSIKLIKKKNIPFVLVQAPVTKNLYYSYTNNPEVDRFFNQYGAYVNFNPAFNLSDSLDFFDEHHLNQNGVIKFNEKLIQQIKFQKKSVYLW
ncbi:MAG: hypothetical protein Q8M15_13140 [Bacteroidota bacterium]|nr:hypothetical protein [Bacteroidota bacterium]